MTHNTVTHNTVTPHTLPPEALHPLGRLVAGALVIDGDLESHEKQAALKSLTESGQSALVAHVEEALDDSSFDGEVYKEGRALAAALEGHPEGVMAHAFQVVTEAALCDKFASDEECSYLLSLAKVLALPHETTTSIFQATVKRLEVRLEISGAEVDKYINPRLKELLTFPGSSGLVGSIEEPQEKE